MKNDKPSKLPPQKQSRQPGIEKEMHPLPHAEVEHIGCNKLSGKVALITGGDSGIGRAVAIAFAKEGANVAITYFDEHEDANETKRLVEKQGRECILFAGNLGEEKFCHDMVNETVKHFEKLDCVVNNAAIHFPQDNIENINAEQLENTFRVNIFSFFYVIQAALRYLKPGSTIINTASVVAYKGHPLLLDYAATKGAIVSFTRSLSLALIDRGIRVNGVAPGPIWTPLIPASFSEKQVEEFGQDTPMHRPGQPNEVAPSFVFLASDDSTYISGQILHPNGGIIVNG